MVETISSCSLTARFVTLGPVHLPLSGHIRVPMSAAISKQLFSIANHVILLLSSTVWVCFLTCPYKSLHDQDNQANMVGVAAT
eukprot:1149358-Pelagomonas_calceolata.AAC.1